MTNQLDLKQMPLFHFYAIFFIINQVVGLPLDIFMLNNSYNDHYGVWLLIYAWKYIVYHLNIMIFAIKLFQ